jgi:tRNA threonylcarbamoyladenosine biosynthesis protein TsaE
MEPTDEPVLFLRLRSRRETARLGRVLAQLLGPGDLLVLEGGLGAGKTCLVQSIVHALGVPKTQPVTSPTFEILHEFQGRLPIIHADLYRLDPSEPLEELGLLPRIGGDAVVLIEWGERFADQLGDSGLRVQLELRRGTERHCALHARGASGRALLEQLAPLTSAAGLVSA